MARKAGLEYYPRAVDMLSDDKIFEFMMLAGDGDDRSDAAFAAMGRLDELFAQIYIESYYIVLDERKRARLAHHLGLSRESFDSFVGTCVSCDLFDRGLYESSSVLTSRGLQERYLNGKKLSRSKAVGDWWLISDILGDSRNFSGNRPKSSAEDKEKKKEREEEEKKTDNPAGEVSAALPCLAVPGEGSSVFIDLKGKPHKTALGAITDSYLASGGRDPTSFAKKLRGLCPASCRGDPGHADECFQLAMRALAKFDPAKGRDPWPLAKTIIEQERGRT